MEIKEILNRLLEREENIPQKNVEKYFFIKQSFPKEIDTDKFQSCYCSFYRLNYARLGSEFKKAYFKLLKDNKESSLRKILEKLHQIKTLRGVPTYQFSFATKLIHTIDNDTPIFDSLVASLFEFPIRKPTIEWCEEAYHLLKNEYYPHLLKDNQIQKLIREFKIKHQAEEISDVKALDFLLWDLGKHLKT